MENSTLIFIILGIFAGGALPFLLLRPRGERPEEQMQKKQRLLNDAKEEARAIRQDAKQQQESIKESAHVENLRREESLKRWEESLQLKTKQVEGRVEKNKQLKKLVGESEETIANLKAKSLEERQGMMQLLLKKTGTQEEELLEQARQRVREEVLARKGKFIQHRLSEVEEDSIKIAKNMLVNALQGYADESSVDHSTTEVIVKQERFKPALIGTQAELIEHFESLIDVEVIFNDFPKTITIGGYNLLKRQTAQEAIELLQQEKGDITLKTIESALKKAEKKIDETMLEQGKKACQKIGLTDVPEGLLQYIGRLYFRTSYGQNALKHCLEVGFFAGLLAAEVGANVEIARIAGFFHDVGKAISEESDKGHDYLTKEILEQYNYPEEIIHAAWVHHEAEPAKTFEAKLVMAADALSASRPGARLESLERYLQRIRELEATAGSFPGIKKTFAISAGREVRVIVKPEEVTDEHMKALAHDIAHKIENELTYPGNVKINVIRRREWEALAGGHGSTPKK